MDALLLSKQNMKLDILLLLLVNHFVLKVS